MSESREKFLERLERLGPEVVRHQLAAGGPIPHFSHPYSGWAAEWLGEKDRQRLVANDASQAAQAEAASRAAKAAERAADAAERANKHANTANIIAIIAIIAAAVSIVIQFMDLG